MKSKQKCWLYGILILLLLIPAVSAQDKVRLAGITPDSIFYGFDVFFDNVRVALTPSILGKATAILDIMEERVAEMGEMAEKNKTTEMKKAESEAQKQIGKFVSSIKGIDAEDVPKLNELTQIHTAELEYIKERILTDDDPNNDDAISGLTRLMKTADYVFGYIDENLSVEKTFAIGSRVAVDMRTIKSTERCEEIYSDISTKEWCYRWVAINTEDADICEKITDSAGKNTCYTDVARHTGDASVCEKIIDSWEKEYCYKFMQEE